MPAPGFGYSAGDFIATIELIAKVVAAFKDGGGASAEYQQVVQELETLLQLLQHIKTIKSTENNLAHVNAIKGVALSIQAPLQKFLDKVTKRYGLLGASQQKGSGMPGLCAGLATAGRKAQWAVVMEKDIAKLRATVGTSVSSILLLLNISHLEATSFIEKLAKKNQQALKTGSAELQKELLSQRKKTESYLLGQANLISGVKTDIKDLTTMSKINADRLGTIERQQNRDSAIFMQFLDFIKSLAISLRSVFPVIYELLCRMILNNLQIYALLVSLQATISQMPTMLLSDNIHFEDVLGRARSLPYQSFRYWKVFKTFLECEFEDLPGEQNVRRGQYHIADARFENILIGEKEWDRKVFPGSRLNMSMIIESFRRMKGSCPVQRCFGKSKLCGGSSPFFVCSKCGLKFTELHQSIQVTIVELEDIPGAASKSPDRAGRGRGPPNPPKALISQSNHSSKRGENNGDRHQRQAELRNVKAEMQKREVDEILNFKRIHISTIEIVELVPDDSKDDVEGDSKDKEADLLLLHEAARVGNATLVQLLLEEGADITKKSGHEWTALHWAAAGGHGQVVQLLLESGAEIMVEEENGWTALHIAASKGYEQVVQLLLNNGAYIIAEQKWRLTALHMAAQHGHEKVVRLLLENGADVMAEMVDRRTALHLAAQHGHKQVVLLLLENGADIMAEGGSDGWTALHLAATKGYEEVVQLLLENGADIMAEGGSDGWTALHLAATKGYEEVVQLLLENEADIMAEGGSEGWTALHLAANRGSEQVVQLLLENGADSATKTTKGHTALQLAVDGGHKQVVSLLSKGWDPSAYLRHQARLLG